MIAQAKPEGATMSEHPCLLRAVEDGVVTLTLNRPQARNALSLGMLTALRNALADVAADEGARVVVIAGAGPAFCAGHDLKELRDGGFDEGYVANLFALCSEVMQAMVNLPKPVIARVHGVATAAGAQLVASADLAFAAEDCAFRRAGRQHRAVLLDADGGAVAQCRAQARAADAAVGRPDRRRDGAAHRAHQ